MTEQEYLDAIDVFYQVEAGCDPARLPLAALSNAARLALVAPNNAFGEDVTQKIEAEFTRRVVGGRIGTAIGREVS